LGFVLGRRSVKVRQLTYQRLKPAPTTALATAAADAAADATAQAAATDATDAAFLGGRFGGGGASGQRNGGGGGNDTTKSAAAAAAAATAATAEAEADAEMIDLLLGAETESDGEEGDESDSGDESGGGDESAAESRRAALEVASLSFSRLAVGACARRRFLLKRAPLFHFS
jgi:hypothetical protein